MYNISNISSTEMLLLYSIMNYYHKVDVAGGAVHVETVVDGGIDVAGGVP